MADDPVGGPVVDRRPPLTGASPIRSIGVPPIYRGFPACTSAEIPSQQAQATTYFHRTDAASLPPENGVELSLHILRGEFAQCMEGMLAGHWNAVRTRGWVLSYRPREARRERDGSCAEGWPGSFAPLATLPQTGPEEIVTTDKHRVP